MKLTLLLAIIPLTLGSTTVTSPPVFTIPYTSGFSPCPTGSTFRQTTTRRGQCLPVFPPTPVPCTVGNSGPCFSGCTPTTTCPPPSTPCLGRCVPSPTYPPQIPCIVGDNGPCPTGSTCTPDMICTVPTPCGGLCIATPLPPIPCVVGAN